MIETMGTGSGAVSVKVSDRVLTVLEEILDPKPPTIEKRIKHCNDKLRSLNQLYLSQLYYGTPDVCRQPIIDAMNQVLPAEIKKCNNNLMSLNVCFYEMFCEERAKYGRAKCNERTS